LILRWRLDFVRHQYKSRFDLFGVDGADQCL
jgi:hypothetical protein